MRDFQHLISAADLRQHYKHPAWSIVDCRFDLMQPDKGHADYLQGHIPGAVYADLDRDLAAPVTEKSGRHPLPDVDVFAALLGRLGIGNDSQVVAYDNAGGALAARLWWMLRWLGHGRVAVLDGSVEAWHATGGEIETEVPEVTAQRFRASPDHGMLIGTSELEKELDTSVPPVLVDARDRSRFLGQTEPIDSVAGHIPGARNFPFVDTLNSDGRWREAGELEVLWRDFFSAGPPDSWITMCGSGVTACHLAISAELAGLAAPRLYVGSWSEWIRDPGRPVAGGE